MSQPYIISSQGGPGRRVTLTERASGSSTERPAQTSPPAEVFGVIETVLRSHFAKEIPA